MLLLCAPVHAEVYKWTDEHGNVHYGDRPTPGSSADEVDLDLQIIDSGIDGQRGEMRERVLDVFQEDREELADKRREQRIEAQRRKQRCARLKERYHRIKHARGVFKRGKDGEKNFYDTDKRAQTEAKYRKAIKRHCS